MASTAAPATKKLSASASAIRSRIVISCQSVAATWNRLDDRRIAKLATEGQHRHANGITEWIKAVVPDAFHAPLRAADTTRFNHELLENGELAIREPEHVVASARGSTTGIEPDIAPLEPWRQGSARSTIQRA